jgi:hypothetical protein
LGLVSLVRKGNENLDLLRVGRGSAHQTDKRARVVILEREPPFLMDRRRHGQVGMQEWTWSKSEIVLDLSEHAIQIFAHFKYPLDQG